jgi:hypothetical protein
MQNTIAHYRKRMLTIVLKYLLIEITANGTTFTYFNLGTNPLNYNENKV